MVSPDPRPPASAEALRLMVLAARLYHVHGVRQRDIGVRLGMSQARVSRLLRQAEDAGLVTTRVVTPDGLHPDLEEGLERAFGLAEAHVVALPDGAADVAALLGRSAARYLAESTWPGAVVGFTSWSRTLQVMAAELPDLSRAGVTHVVEMLGDLGDPLQQHQATRATQSLARSLGADPVFLRTPGVAATTALRVGALRDVHVQRALRLLDDLDVAFVGVGPAAVHSQLQAGENYFTERQLEQARVAGALSQLNQRFLDGAGRALHTPLDDLVVGATLHQIRSARRRVVVAGGPAKHAALAAALTGRWVDVLVTDDATAQELLRGAALPLPEARMLG